MSKFIDEINNKAGESSWRVKPIGDQDVKIMGFQNGTELTSPHDTFKISVFESRDELLCTFGDYGRIELHFSEEEKDKKAQRLLDILSNVFHSGITVETYKRGDRVLRAKVFGGSEQRTLLSKTVNGFGFFGGVKDLIVLKP